MPEPQLVYEPEMWPDFAGTERHEEIKSWLRANDINPDDVAVTGPVTVETTPDGARLIRYTTHLRNEDGCKYLADPDDMDKGVAAEERTAPVQVEPPMHWYIKEATDGR
jgi:hypothetical protein